MRNECLRVSCALKLFTWGSDNEEKNALASVGLFDTR